MTDEITHLAQRAQSLLNDDAFAHAMTQVKMDALLALAKADAASFKEICRLQAIVQVLDEVVDKLKAAITRTGAHDGGLTFPATRTANTAN